MGQKWVTSTGNGLQPSAYHTNKDCRYLSESDPVRIDNRRIEWLDIEICEQCKSQ